MKRIRLRIAYDGTNYCGWQRQDNAVTVEEKLQEALDGLFYKGIEILGASRTDSGVHALGNVAVFDVETRIPAEKIAIALNHQLPHDIRIMQSDEVSAKFHPRYCDSRKTYEYTITHTDTEIPTRSRTSYHVYRPLDLEMMRQCAKYLEGEHDFSAFCSAGAQVQSKVRRVYSVEIRRNELPVTGGEEIVIRVQGNGFLYNMVRIIAGTLIEVGMGRRSIETVKEAIETGERSLAGPTAPAKGLTLVRIDYDE
ncbi:MAG: tRNA pseudouridine(38-40) synthase TruA [Eubacterium sp.]|nr:tRNA pseudouridine(38-40) synthase TruA [Eubacterium sp.]